MIISELFENFISGMKSKSPEVIDYREKDYNVVKYEPYTHDHLIVLAAHNIKPNPKGRKIDIARTHIVLAKNNKLIVFCYGSRNVVPWRELLNILYTEIDKEIQSNIFGIVEYQNGYIINQERGELKQWSGHLNRYSLDIRKTLQGMVDRGISPTTPIWIGNWAGQVASEKLGTIKQILQKKDIPDKLVLYHGTSSFRLSLIKNEGLQPVSKEERVWNKGSLQEITYRDDSVYLTASFDQAEYYAKKATNIDRARYGSWKNKSIAYNKIRDFENMISKDKEKLSPEQLKDIEGKIQKLKNMMAFDEKFTPVILQVAITKSNYNKLKPDDDYLRVYPDAPKDWENSLSQFGQVAYQGTIPFSNIKIL